MCVAAVRQVWEQDRLRRAREGFYEDALGLLL